MLAMVIVLSGQIEFLTHWSYVTYACQLVNNACFARFQCFPAKLHQA